MTYGSRARRVRRRVRVRPPRAPPAMSTHRCVRRHAQAALILEPMTMGGTVAGVVLNILSPVGRVRRGMRLACAHVGVCAQAWIIVILLFLTLGYSSWTTLARAMRLHEVRTGEGPRDGRSH